MNYWQVLLVIAYMCGELGSLLNLQVVSRARSASLCCPINAMSITCAVQSAALPVVHTLCIAAGYTQLAKRNNRDRTERIASVCFMQSNMCLAGIVGFACYHTTHARTV